MSAVSASPGIKKKPLGAASAALLVMIVFTAIFAEVLSPYDPLAPQPRFAWPRRRGSIRSAPTTSAATC